MSRTHKTLLKQNLHQIPVLINDIGGESSYFNIKQLSGVFSGGRNSFLIAGTQYLKPNTEIFIEVLDVNGNSLYVEVIKGIVEAGARVVVVEIYENVPPGAAILTIVGTAKQNIAGTVLSDKHTQRPNVRWQKKIIIEPSNKNTTPIRLKVQPEIIVQELLTTSSLLSQSFNSVGANFILTPKYADQKQVGYILRNNTSTPFASYQKSPTVSGSLFLETRAYTYDIPYTTASYVINKQDTASVYLPLSLLNNTQSLSNTNITSSVDKAILNITPLLSGTYQITSSAYSASNTQYLQTITFVTSSVKYKYVSQSIINTSESISLAKLRIINLGTVTGEIHRVKTSNKSSETQLEYNFIADTPTLVGEILVTGSVIINERETAIGVFNTDNILNSNWYGYLITGSSTPDQSYYTASSALSLVRTDANMLDGTYVQTTSASYFFGTKNQFTVFPNSEYTLGFDTYTSSSIPSSLDVYLVGSSVVTTNPLGQKLGTITTSESIAYFPQTYFNFSVPLSGSVGIRFITTNGNWQFANVSLQVAKEFAFSPDEVTLILQNDFNYNNLITYKTEFFDINNNAINIETTSLPAYFTGSRKYVLRSGDTMSGRLVIERSGAQITGSTNITGSFSINTGASATPSNNGDMVFQLTNNTTLTLKARGSDGVVRSGSITLS